MKNAFFILAQTELGDLFKITIDWTEDVVRRLSISYFDTISTSLALCILKAGFLFSAPEFGNQYVNCVLLKVLNNINKNPHRFLYQIESLGDEDGDEAAVVFHSDSMDEDDEDVVGSKYCFDVHGLKHLVPVDETPNLCPVVDAKIMNLTDEDTPQIYALCGRSAQSSLRILRRGLEVTEIVSYPLPGTPSAVWSIKTSEQGIIFGLLKRLTQ
jgi:splicing factor 3B subunit 3